jgi:glycosyltransferase involved in cell wall biosynthesis
MRLSVFTPSNNPRWLDDCFRSLQRQTYQNWQWVVLLNGQSPNWQPPEQDDRVAIYRASSALRGVGAAKRSACGYADGDILVELDHDDVLTPNCLELLAQAFADHPETVLAYSDFSQINDDGSPNLDRFNAEMGWVYSEVDIDGTTYLSCHALAPTPHNVGYIWYAPNHVRAFRRDAYEQVGGYDASLEVLDDQELMIRLFLAGDFHHIPECLYLQRIHGANTQVEPSTNAYIQQQTAVYYQQHIDDLARAWASRRGLAVINLRTPTSMENEDWHQDETVTIDPDKPLLPYDDNSVGLILATDVLQRVPARAALFNECYRVLEHAGMIQTETPSTDGRGAFQDPSHVAFYNENSFWYLTQARLRTSIPDLTARLQVGQLRTYHPTPWHEQVQIPYVQAGLLAIKAGPRQGGPLLS